MMVSSMRLRVGAIWRATNLVPSAVAALAAAGLLISAAATDQADPSPAIVGTLLVSTCVIGFSLDDDAATTLAASPTTLRRRRSVAAAGAVLPVLVTWCFAVVLIDQTWAAHSVGLISLALEFAALTLLSLALAARWGAIAGCIGGPTISMVLTVLAFRFDGIPSLPLGSAWHERWSFVALAALAWFIWEVRDPAAPRVRLGTGTRTRVVAPPNRGGLLTCPPPRKQPE